nr:hypothetical protein [Kribbella pratensis]
MATVARFPRDAVTRPAATSKATARWAVLAATPYRAARIFSGGNGSP